MTGKRYTDKQRREVERLWAAGLPWREVMERTGVRSQTAHLRAKGWNVPRRERATLDRRERQRYEADRRWRRITRGGRCAECGLPTTLNTDTGQPHPLCKPCALRALNAKRGFTPERRQRVERLWRRGLPWKRIKQLTGVTESPSRYRKRAGWDLPPRDRARA